MSTEKYSWTFVQGSTNIAAVSFLPKDPLADFGTLRIRFTSGAEYEYEKVPSQLAEEFFESESKGGFFHINIRPKFDGVKMDDEDHDESLAEDLPAELPDTTEADWEEQGGPPLPVPHRNRWA